MVWIIRNQFARRNLTPYQRSKLALKLEEFYRTKGKENLKIPTGGKKSMTLQKSAKSKPIDTRQELSKIAGVSHDTIAKVKKIEENASNC